MVSLNFAQTTGHSLYAFVCKGVFKVVDGLLRFSSRKPISKSKCLLAAGERHDTSNISFLQDMALQTNNSLWGMKHVFRDANNSITAKPRT